MLLKLLLFHYNLLEKLFKLYVILELYDPCQLFLVKRAKYYLLLFYRVQEVLLDGLTP